MKIILEKEELTDGSHVYNCYIEDDNGGKVRIDLSGSKRSAHNFTDTLRTIISAHASIYPLNPDIEYINC